MGVSGQRHAPAALYPWGKDPRYPSNRGCVGPRAGLNAEVRGKISNLDRPVVESVVRHYTDWATPAHNDICCGPKITLCQTVQLYSNVILVSKPSGYNLEDETSVPSGKILEVSGRSWCRKPAFRKLTGVEWGIVCWLFAIYTKSYTF
jgi:hypothetical protein